MLRMRKIGWTGRGYHEELLTNNERLVALSGDSDSKESACNAGDPGLTAGLGRSPGE